MIKVAFIGAGNMASEHAKAFRDLKAVELVGVYSRTRSRAESYAATHAIANISDSIAELFTLTQPDLVVIAVPELQTRDVCEQAFRHPWTCLIEKPAGFNVVDAERILGAARETGRTAFVALNRRHYSATRAVLKDLEAHPGPRMIHVLDQEDRRVALETGTPPEVVDHWMYANSLHLVDYFSIFCRGQLVSVSQHGKWQPSQPCFVVAQLAYSSGDIGTYEAVWEGPGPWGVTVTTHGRRWELRPLERAAFQDYGSRQSHPIEVDPWDTQFKPGLRLQAEEAIRAVRGEAHRLPSIQESIESMKVVRKIYGN